MSDFDNYINSLNQLDQSELKTELENFYAMHYAVLQLYQGIDAQVQALMNAPQLNEKMVSAVLAQLNKHLGDLSKLKFKLSKIKPEKLSDAMRSEILEHTDYIREQMVLSEIELITEHLNELLADNDQRLLQEQLQGEKQKHDEEAKRVKAEQEKIRKEKEEQDRIRRAAEEKREAEEEQRKREEKLRKEQEIENIWQEVEQKATIKDYYEYTLVYPQSKYVSLANYRIKELQHQEKLDQERKQKEEQERLEKQRKEEQARKAREAEEQRLRDMEGEMILVESGSFKRENRDIQLDSFFIGKYPVTQKQWQAVMGNNPSSFKGDNRPVETVNYHECNQFISKLNQLTGKNYRLPTEAEWEFAAGGGKPASLRKAGRLTKWAGTDNESELRNYAWFADNSGGQTQPVGQKQPNELGIYDMSGNVWEWCSDWYDANYYANSPTSNPQGPSSGSDRVSRGGSWSYSADYCRVACRGSSSPGSRGDNLGFRLVFVP